MRSVQIVREQVDGNAATVSLRLHLVDGSTNDQQETLVKESGEWKIDDDPGATDAIEAAGN
jgi:hypothetical protein